MNEKLQELEVKTQSEAELTAKIVGKAEESEAKTTRDAVQEAKREAQEAKRASLKARREAQLATKKLMMAKKAEARARRRDEMIVKQERKRRATVSQGVGPVEAELAEEVELAVAETTREEVREVELVTEGAAKVKEAKEVSTQLYEGTISLVIMPPAGALQIKNLEERLRLIQNLRVVLTRGSVDEPTRIVVSAEQAIPLIDALSKIPIVDQVTKEGKKIKISLKTIA